MSDFKDSPKHRRIFLVIMNNLKIAYNRTGKVGKKKYDKWEHAEQHAYVIANKIMEQRYPEYFTHQNKTQYESKDNKQLADELEYYYQLIKRDNLLDSFNHPDYRHVHENIDLE